LEDNLEGERQGIVVASKRSVVCVWIVVGNRIFPKVGQEIYQTVGTDLTVQEVGIKIFVIFQFWKKLQTIIGYSLKGES
jgi:hypothetical protein